jgi:hypothetical protein
MSCMAAAGPGWCFCTVRRRRERDATRPGHAGAPLQPAHRTLQGLHGTALARPHWPAARLMPPAPLQAGAAPAARSTSTRPPSRCAAAACSRLTTATTATAGAPRTAATSPGWRQTWLSCWSTWRCGGGSGRGPLLRAGPAAGRRRKTAGRCGKRGAASARPGGRRGRSIHRVPSLRRRQVTGATVVGTSMGCAVIWSYIELFGEARLVRIGPRGVGLWQCVVLHPPPRPCVDWVDLLDPFPWSQADTVWPMGRPNPRVSQ